MAVAYVPIMCHEFRVMSLKTGDDSRSPVNRKSGDVFVKLENQQTESELDASSNSRARIHDRC